MPDARAVEVFVEVPAGVRVDLAGERNPSSGGRIRVTSIASSQDDAEAQVAAFGDAVKDAVAEPAPLI